MKKIILFLFLMSSCGPTSLDKVDTNYGASYNFKRKMIGLADISANTKLSEDIKGKRYIYSPLEKNKDIPRFMWKILSINEKGVLHHESDYYYNPFTKSWLLLNHNYIVGSTEYEYQTEPEAVKVSSLGIICRRVFDSVLVSWQLK